VSWSAALGIGGTRAAMHQVFRVLNVDDDDGLRTRKTALLRNAGFDVIETSRAAEALRLARTERLDLILLDAQLPDGRGIDVCRELQPTEGSGAPERDRPFAIVLISPGETTPDDIARGIAAGADAHLVAPLDDTHLTNLIRVLAERYARRRAAAEEHAELRARDSRYRILAATVGDAIYDWDLTADRMEWSDAVYRVLRYRPDSVGATSQWWVDRIHSEDRGRVMGDVHRIMMERQPTHEIEYRFARNDGSYAVIADRLTIIYEEGGRPLRAVGAMSDISERRLMGDQLRLAQKMEAVGLLAGSIAHDFNNVLTSILGFAGLLKHEVPDRPTAFAHADEIESAAIRAAELIARLLAFSRGQVLKTEVVDLSQAITDGAPVLHRLIGAHIQVEHVLASPLPTVRMDRLQLEQVLLNLAVNARDAMPRGGVLTIRTSVAEPARVPRLLPPGRYVALSVTDTGIGMDDATRARIFEPFFTTKERGRGTGLGLATVYGIVKQSGGHISVTSAPSAGTTVDIFLPALDLQPTAHAAVPSESDPAVSRGETVLVVEDERAVRRLVQQVLTRAGYHVLEAEDGREALSLAAEFSGPIHLLLTDIVLPGVSGTVVGEKLKMLRPNLCVLYMSGYSSRAHRRDVSRVGAPRLVSKPFLRDVLLRAVRRALKAAPADGVLTDRG
jgi:two-component system, cell cycle sensor histidine kinase and response regulator CckA